ncbi:MAG: hypothetical protein OEM28_01480 [Nitrosopumilus sp.]|nr:hypothetical protein [Nitrosopumilus sp.]MDH3486539.1 hypothetical protein [Nitrosopumilus sp.]
MSSEKVISDNEEKRKYKTIIGFVVGVILLSMSPRHELKKAKRN